MVRRKNGERSEKEEKKKKRDKDSTTAGSRKRTLSVTTRYAPSSSESEDLDAIWAQKRSHRTLTLYTFKSHFLVRRCKKGRFWSLMGTLPESLSYYPGSQAASIFQLIPTPGGWSRLRKRKKLWLRPTIKIVHFGAVSRHLRTCQSLFCLPISLWRAF